MLEKNLCRITRRILLFVQNKETLDIEQFIVVVTVSVCEFSIGFFVKSAKWPNVSYLTDIKAIFKNNSINRSTVYKKQMKVHLDI